MIRFMSLLFLPWVLAAEANAYQVMEIFCDATDGEEVWIGIQFEGEDAEGGNVHQTWIERWTDDYFFQLNYQHSGLESDEGLPYSWTAFQVDLNTMEFTNRMLWNSEIYLEQEGICSGINVKQV